VKETVSDEARKNLCGVGSIDKMQHTEKSFQSDFQRGLGRWTSWTRKSNHTMMSGFVERIINNPHTRYRSAKQLCLQTSSERQIKNVCCDKVEQKSRRGD